MNLKPVPWVFDPTQGQKRAIALDMSRPLEPDDMWEALLTDSPVPVSEVRKYPSGHIFDRGDPRVIPKAEGWSGKLNVGNADMMQDLQRAYAGEAESEMQDYRFKMVGRRLKDRYNSCWREHSVSTRQWTYNPAFMHPDDAASLGLADGDIVEIRSRRGAIKGVVEIEKGLLPGVIAMTHSWGGIPDDDPDPVRLGANTSLLTDTTADYDPYSAIPRMSTIPVNVRLIE